MENKFAKAPDKDGLVFRRRAPIVPGRTLQIGLWPTLFGMRVRAGWEGELSYQIDWCCGADNATIALAYKLCLAVLNARLGLKADQIFAGIPLCSKIKPIPLDPEFMAYVSKLPQKPIEIEAIPDFHKLRESHHLLMEKEWPKLVEVDETSRNP